MAVLDIITYPDPRLKQCAETVDCFDEQLQQLVQDLIDTMSAGPGGVGIAAPQVGVLQRVAVVDVSAYPRLKKNERHHGLLVLVNPEIMEWEGMKKGREGCMSVPDFTGNVIRATHIVVSAQDQYGVQHEYQMEGFEARAVQHELDHLDGLLFLDRLVSRRNDLFRRQVVADMEQ